MNKKTPKANLSVMAEETRVSLYDLYIELTQQLGGKTPEASKLHCILLEYVEWEKQYIGKDGS